MYIVKFLKRRDASSVVVAIVLGLILINVLQNFGFDLSNRIVLSDEMKASDTWRSVYLVPIVAALIELVLLEVVLRIFVPARAAVVRRKR